jgi:hypothetical protein
VAILTSAPVPAIPEAIINEAYAAWRHLLGERRSRDGLAYTTFGLDNYRLGGRDNLPGDGRKLLSRHD